MPTLAFDSDSLAEIFREFDLCLVILFGSQVTVKTHADLQANLERQLELAVGAAVDLNLKYVSAIEVYLEQAE